jgi:hypothetical protein
MITGLSAKAIEYLRAGPLLHRRGCDANKEPSGMQAALQGPGQDGFQTYTCTCGLVELRMEVGRNY